MPKIKYRRFNFINNSYEHEELVNEIFKIINERKPQNVEQTIHFIKEHVPIKEKKIIEVFLDLEQRGLIKFEESVIHNSYGLACFLKTNHSLWYWLTITLAIIVPILVFFTENIYPLPFIRVVFSTVFLFLLPGYSITKALFPMNMEKETSGTPLDYIKRISLSFGLSLVIVALNGLILNYTPFGIQLTPLMLSLFFLIVIFSSVGILREYRLKKSLLS